jgi:Xaa-Pro dipeptidase
MNETASLAAHPFARAPLPKRFCNLERLMFAMKARGLDGIVATQLWNVFYLSGFNAIAHKSDEPRPYAVILSRHAPEHPVMVLADYYLATFLTQPSWIEDLRPFRAVMMPLDLPAQRRDIDRFIPKQAGAPWLANARAKYSFDMASAVRGALAISSSQAAASPSTTWVLAFAWATKGSTSSTATIRSCSRAR